MSLQQHGDSAAPVTPAAEASAFISEVLPNGATGKLCAAIGGVPRWTAAGYKPGPGWTERAPVDYPQDVAAELDSLLQWSAGRDVYVCTGLSYANRRTGSLREAWALHVDWDGDPASEADCLETVSDLDGFAILSGTPGHLQCYLPLCEAIITAGRYAQFCKAFQSYLPPGSDAAKHQWNDLLRLPGTLNHKATVRPGDTGQPTPVVWALRPSGARRDPDTLAELFGLSATSAGAERSGSDPRPALPRSASNGSASVPVDLDALPEPVRAALALDTGDRSEDTARVVGAAADAGLTLAQARGAVASRPDLAGRLAERNDDDVLACWLKALDARQIRMTEQAEAAEFHDGYRLRETQSTAAYSEARPTAGDQPDQYEKAVLQHLSQLRVRAEAQRRLDGQTRPALVLPPVKALDDLLSEPDSAAAYLIGEVQPVDSRVMLSAQYKAGKTTLVGNLARSLVDGEKFLGHFEINRPCAHIVLIDNELSENMIRSWLRAQGIANTAAVADVIALRGKVSAFNLLDDKCRDRWARRFRDTGCDYLVLDCLRPVLDSLGLDENRDAGTFLVAYDELLCAAGIPNSLLVQHMGHSNERARGDSRLQDWPDAIWRLVRESDEPDSPRYFSAYGRDVDVREGGLSFDPMTRRLTYGQGGSRLDARAEDAMGTVIDVLAETTRNGGDPMSKREVERATTESDHNRQAIREGIGLALARGYVIAAPGPRRATVLSIASPCIGCGKPILASTGGWHRSCTPTASASGL